MKDVILSKDTLVPAGVVLSVVAGVAWLVTVERNTTFASSRIAVLEGSAKDIQQQFDRKEELLDGRLRTIENLIHEMKGKVDTLTVVIGKGKAP